MDVPNHTNHSFKNQPEVSLKKLLKVFIPLGGFLALDQEPFPKR